MKVSKINFGLLITAGLIYNSCSIDNVRLGGFSEFVLSGDTYTQQEENPFIQVSKQPISTFSIDADGASYANVRRFIQEDNQLPPKGAVRTEELINYFNLDYRYSDPTHPISLNGEVSQCP